MSAPTAIFSPKAAIASRLKPGSVTAAEPRIIRFTPAEMYFSIISGERMPPPTSQNSPLCAAISEISPRFGVLPLFAPSRSTMCRKDAPVSEKPAARGGGVVRVDRHLRVVAAHKPHRLSPVQIYCRINIHS